MLLKHWILVLRTLVLNENHTLIRFQSNNQLFYDDINYNTQIPKIQITPKTWI